MEPGMWYALSAWFGIAFVITITVIILQIRENKNLERSGKD